MKRCLATVAAAALITLPVLAEAKPGNNGNGNGHGNGHGNASANRGNGNPGRGNGNGRGNGQVRNQNASNGHGNGNGRGNGDGGGTAAATAGAVTAAGQARPDAFANLGAVFDCPPGLAHRDPPCVPPGQAKKGVTFQEWTGVSDEELEELLDEAAVAVEDVVVDVDEELYLTEAEIIDLFDLDPAPDGYRYAVIDGQVVQLTDENYDMLQQIRTLASTPDLDVGLLVEPTVSLTEDELIAIYDLPDPEEGSRYSVVDGTVVSLAQDSYDLLQLIRLVSSV